MKSLKTLLLLGVALVATACAWRRTPVRVVSENGSTAALVGEWSGEYRSDENGRSGSIVFQLASERDTAYGDVVMVPRMRVVQAPSVTRAEIPGERVAVLSEPLRIRFVRIADDKVSGRLAPYTDPDYNCSVTTVFEGKFTNDNTIEGTYITHGSELPDRGMSGKWKVTRKAARP
jgi:hypothetical protein